MEPPRDIDHAAIEEHAQRTVEQTALRKVRKTLDEIERAQSAERRTLRKVLVVCALLALLGAWLSWELVFSDRGMPKPQPIEIPAALQPRR